MTKKELEASKRAVARYDDVYKAKYNKSILTAVEDGTLADEFKQIAEIAKIGERLALA
ncbi:MAG: hypothetical protein Nk1A_7840 [Endomicrobiia bacterium]|nr:MAG: hypothetical protein Nk1A_7840 [Endomicrobiia bacterium]